MDALENYITKKIYDLIYPKERTYKDAALYCRLRSLSWMSYKDLDIKV